VGGDIMDPGVPALSRMIAAGYVAAATDLVGLGGSEGGQASVGMLAEIEAVRRRARSSGGARNVGALLRRLTQMESRFGSIHAEELAKSVAPAVQKLLAALATQDAKHSEMIRKAEARLRA
jgi:hypothetical protein